MSISINISPAESLHPQRHWITLDEGKEFHENLKFRVCTYNLLDTKHAKRDKYDYCIDEVLSWGYRKSLIIKQVLDYSPDLMAFQEVEPAMYEDLKLELKNYDSTYFQKQKSPYSRKKDKNNKDGCALFWNKDKFQLDKIKRISFLKQVRKRFQKFLPKELFDRIYRTEIALAASFYLKKVLKNQENPKEVELYKIPIIFCGTHIYWNPEFADVKLIQTMILLSELKKFRCFIAKNGEIDEEKIPMIIAGDFNSTPKSSVFSYTTKGYCLRTNKELGPFLGKNYLDSLSDSDDPRFYKHGLKLDSLSQEYVPFTNFWTGFKDTLDYMFSTPDLLCLKVLGPIDDGWYINNRIIGFPNEFVPSDHIPVVMEYAYVMEEYIRAYFDLQINGLNGENLLFQTLNFNSTLTISQKEENHVKLKNLKKVERKINTKNGRKALKNIRLAHPDVAIMLEKIFLQLPYLKSEETFKNLLERKHMSLDEKVIRHMWEVWKKEYDKTSNQEDTKATQDLENGLDKVPKIINTQENKRAHLRLFRKHAKKVLKLARLTHPDIEPILSKSFLNLHAFKTEKSYSNYVKYTLNLNDPDDKLLSKAWNFWQQKSNEINKKIQEEVGKNGHVNNLAQKKHLISHINNPIKLTNEEFKVCYNFAAKEVTDPELSPLFNYLVQQKSFPRKKRHLKRIIEEQYNFSNSTISRAWNIIMHYRDKMFVNLRN